VEAVDEYIKCMKEVRSNTESALRKAAEDMVKYYDAGRQEAPEYQVGDKVWLDASDIKTTRPSKKLDFKRLGPFEIIKKVSSHTYKLKLPRTMKNHRVFNIVKLRPFTVDPIPECRPVPPVPPVVVGNGPDSVEYEVKSINDSRLFWKKHLQYLVQWKGYRREDHQWEPVRTTGTTCNLANALTS
jgi:hypothetical protein